MPTTGAKGLESSLPTGFGVPTALRRQGLLQARSPVARPTFPPPHSLSCPPLPSPPVPAQPRARVCYCEGARGEEGGGAQAGAGACTWAPRQERALRAARRGGTRHPRRPRPISPTRIGSRHRERARARRVGPGEGRARRRRRPRRSAGRRAEEERGEEGEGREEAPAWLPSKRPYLPEHSLSLPGGRFGGGAILSHRGAPLGVRPRGLASPRRWARGAAGPCRPSQHLGRLPASPAPMPGSPRREDAR